MLDYLTRHAVENVWCSPLQDRQAMLKPARLTTFGGAVGNVNVMWDKLPLPDCTNDYHVYQFGQNNPYRLALMNERCRWIKISDLCNSQNGIIDIYTAKGVQLPRTESYIRRNHDQNFIIAVKMQPLIADLNYEDLYFRFYKGAYFDSAEQDPTSDHIYITGGTMRSIQEAVDLQHEYFEHLEMSGTAYLFHNGKYVTDISPSKVKTGDVIEMVYDASISKVIDFPLGELETYESKLDALMKYLIHPPKYGDAVIQYRDDVDFFLLDKNGQHVSGYYYHKNREPSVRMVTHRDYGIPVTYVRSLLQEQLSGIPESRINIRIHIKKSGYNRKLVDEHNRIKELYKLPDDELVRAMLGIDSTIVEWKASHLEESNYTRIMRSCYPEITPDKVVDAYGYNAIVKLVANTPTKIDPTPGNNYVELPVGLQGEATFFEYDQNGLLLEWRNQKMGERYYSRNPLTHLVEGIVGVGGNPKIVKGNDNVVINPDYGYRFYHCPLKQGLPTNKWVEVTASPSTFEIIDGICQWKHNLNSFIGAVKNDRYFVCYDYEISARHDFYEFTLNENGTDFNPLWITPGTLSIFMNGHGLIEDLDYYVDYPKVVIVNAEYLVEDKQRFTIRGTGFCKPDMSRERTDQVGFVEYGLLSYNDRFDLRDDKVIRILVNGKTFDRSDVKFAELVSGTRNANLLDGRPYQIENLRIPIRGLPAEQTKALLERSEDLDRRLSDYLTLKLPEVEYDVPVYIPELYHVYSPLMGRLIADIKNDALTIPYLDGGDRQIREVVAPYLTILPFDPAYREVNKTYVGVIPHPRPSPVGVKEREWVFLEAVNRLYLRNRLDLSVFVTIEGL